MKFTVHSSTLADSISAAVTSLPSRAAAAILGGILVEANTASVAFSSFNYDRATTRTVLADVAEPDTAVVSGRLLAAVGNSLPRNTESTVTASESGMVIAAGRSEFRLPAMHAADYPAIPKMYADDVIGAVNCAQFSDAVRVIGGFASTDLNTEALKNLTALNLGFEPGQLVLRATDRYIVGRRELAWRGRTADPVNVVANDLLATIKAVFGTGTEDVEIMCNDSLVGLRTPSTTVITRILAEDFPKVDNVMRVDSYHTTATVAASALASMIKRAASIADDEYGQVDIAATRDSLSVTTSGESTGGVADAIDAITHGVDRSLCVSSRRLHKALTAIDDQLVTLAFQKGKHLLSIYPGPIEPSEEGILHPPDTDTVSMLMGIRTDR